MRDRADTESLAAWACCAAEPTEHRCMTVPSPGHPLVLDAGALLAVDRADRRVVRLLELTDEVHVPAGALAQAWRNPARQARLARVVGAAGVRIHALDAAQARAAGQLCAAAGTADVVDASVVLVGRSIGGVVVTSDPGDLARLAPGPRMAGC